MFGCLQLVCGAYYLWCRINWSGDEIFIGWPGILPRIYISLTSVSCVVHMVTGCLVCINLGEDSVMWRVEKWFRKFSLVYAVFITLCNPNLGPLTHTVSLLSLIAAINN